ncbi:MAG: GAF domain-containing protein [Mucilaginibacter sp.]|nr:GAF domain-containing protein [Mucilaginibacter sp.]
MADHKNYDSEFCGNLPLNQINVIQDYGYLLALKLPGLEIIQVSTNLPGMLGSDLHDLIDKPLQQVLDPKEISKLEDRLSRSIPTKAPLTIHVNDQVMDLLVHHRKDHVILELERKINDDRIFNSVFEEIRFAIDHIEQCQSIEETTKVAVSEIRKITGFDGVMMYQFDQDWNGTVVAEEKAAGMDNYLGLTFPASDVPKQARELYLKNPYRLIPDRNYQAIRLHPVVNPVTRSFTDLSTCNIRGVAGVHLEYLENMNVTASMSIRVIHHGKLWGLIACHHQTKKYLSLEKCSVCDLFSSAISAKIESLIHLQGAEIETILQKDQTALITQVYSKDDLIAGLIGDDNLNIATLFSADSAVLINDDKLYWQGSPFNEDFLHDLVLWLQTQNENKLFYSDRLPLLFEEAKAFAEDACGIIAFPIDAERGDYAICFRKEYKKEISWGGDPNQAINFEPDGKKYHPRNSFRLWEETIHYTSKPWRNEELAVADAMRAFIYEYQTRKKIF